MLFFSTTQKHTKLCENGCSTLINHNTLQDTKLCEATLAKLFQQLRLILRTRLLPGSIHSIGFNLFRALERNIEKSHPHILQERGYFLLLSLQHYRSNWVYHLNFEVYYLLSQKLYSQEEPTTTLSGQNVQLTLEQSL